MHIEIVRTRQKIDNIIKKIESITNSGDTYDFELVAHMTKYLCVIVSGFFEKSIYYLVLEYTEGKSHPHINSYFNNELKKFTNANIEKIEKLFKKFNSHWFMKLEEIDNFDKLKGSVNTIVSQRHRIAHGLDSNISFVRLIDHYKDINLVVDYIKDEILELK